MRSFRLILLCFISLALVACKNEVQAESEVVENHSVEDSSTTFNPHKGPIKPICSSPPPVENIWALEPMLIEKGLITQDMSKEQREAVIRNYINNKNSIYEKCLKGK